MPYDPPKLTVEQTEPVAINPLDLLEPMLKNRWIFGLIVAVCVLTAFFYNLYATPIYSAQSSVIIRRNLSSSVIREQVSDVPNMRNTTIDFNTKVKMVTSETFVEDLAKKLIERGYFKQQLREKGYDRMDPDAKAIFIRRLGDMTKANIDVGNPKMTNIVTISYQSPNRPLARDVVNLLAEQVVEFGQNEDRIILENTLGFLDQQLEDSRIKVREAEDKLFKYRVDHNIFESISDRELISNRRGQLQQNLTNIQEGMREREAKIKQIGSLLVRKDYTKYTAIEPGDPVLSGLSEMLTLAEIKYDELLIKYGVKHPQVISAAQEIEILRSKFGQELVKTKTRLEYELNVYESRGKALQEALAEVEANAVTGTEKDIDYVVLDRDANSARDLYKTLLQAVKEVSVASNNMTNNLIYVHERAILPQSPVKPRKTLNLLMGLFLGIVLGVTIVYGREFLDQSIRNPEDVEKAAQLPVLSTVPLYIGKGEEKDRKTTSLYLTHHPKSLFSESIAALRTHLNIKLPQETSVAILITSSAPREGKSLIAANLAASMAMDGKKTVIVDADLHRPYMHKAFGKDKHTGVFDMIVDALNPRWSELDMKALSFGDLRHIIRLKQWSGTMKIQWDSLPSTLNISYREGRPVGSNITEWKNKFAREGSFPSPQNPGFSLDESAISEVENPDSSGAQALGFIGQYPRLRASRYFIDVVLKRYTRETEVENLHLITAGTNPKNPNEILGSEQMKILLQLLKERYERIIIDCPPSWPLSDVSVLSPLIDGVLWVCRVGEIPKGMFSRVVKQIQAVQPNILGVVLNAVDLHRDRYYYYGYSYYYYRYYRSSYYNDYLNEPGSGKKSSRSRKGSLPAKP
ncbi:MAG TPA: GNVR domain-containing protein [bacterium]|nr:GNVR domain-containing protein [bacterium]